MMQKLLAHVRFPAIMVFVVAAIGPGGLGLYSGLGLDEPSLFSLLIRLCWLWAIGWWLTDDLVRRRERWPYCPGIFLLSAWLFVLPYYLLKTRGPRALIVIAVFAGFSIAAATTGLVIGALLTQPFP